VLRIVGKLDKTISDTFAARVAAAVRAAPELLHARI
jgi:hypothetical protein